MEELEGIIFFPANQQHHTPESKDDGKKWVCYDELPDGSDRFIFTDHKPDVSEIEASTIGQ